MSKKLIRIYLVGSSLAFFSLLSFGCLPPMVALASPSIGIDPISIHQSGETFEITGTTTDSSCTRIGMEIFPKPYWDNACRITHTDNAHRFRFMVQYITDSIQTAELVKLIRYNNDQTESYIFYPPCPDYIKNFAQVHSQHKENSWHVSVGDRRERRYLNPGAYILFVWNASNEQEHPDTYQPNGWDITGNHVYPAAIRANIWDLENRQNCTKAFMTILKSPSEPIYTDYSRLDDYISLNNFASVV